MCTEQWRIQSWSQAGFPSHKFKWLVKVGASKGVIRVDFIFKNHGHVGGGVVSGQPKKSWIYVLVHREEKMCKKL